MSLFNEWNSILLDEYFSPSKANQDVWISTTRLELEGIGIHKGGANGLIEAVKQGPAWLNGSSSIGFKAKELAKQRLYRYKRTSGYTDPASANEIYKDANAPTYLPYLALWVLARSESGEQGFYSTVSELVQASFPNSSRQQMEAVWVDLEHWSNQQKGRFGRFKVNVLGEHRFVGMAYSQAMVTSKDIDGISRLFGSCRLHPGQELNDADLDLLLEHGEDSNYLSTGLKGAMGNKVYRGHLKQLLSSYLEFWDGRIPKFSSITTRASQENTGQHQEDADEVSIILQLKSFGDTDAWEIGWRLPSILTGSDYKITVGNTKEKNAKLELAGTHIFSLNDVNQNEARVLVDESAENDVEAILSCTGNNGLDNKRSFVLKRNKIRFFVWDKPDPLLTDTLVEREMPVTGVAYLLYSHKAYSNLKRILSNHSIHIDTLEIGGLPDDWSLICLDGVEKLTSEQRAEITDEEPTASTKARIRLVGGRPITGAGNKKYAYYDLPIIELEAPSGTKLESAGLTFEELDGSNVVRRFKYDIDPEAGSIFKIRAILNDEILSSVGLKVLAVGGLASTDKKNFSIDRFGVANADENGLSGAVIGVQKEDTCLNFDSFEYFKIDTGVDSILKGQKAWEKIETNISCKFLDSIATTRNGSMTFGVARDQIRRLANDMFVDGVEPAILLRQLRRRGHIEIETNIKGHMVRVCAVKPTVYSLPIKNYQGSQLYTVCGSLRLQQWKKLLESIDCDVNIEIKETHSLPIVRLSPDSRLSIQNISEAVKLQIVELPILDLCKWLGSIDEVKQSLRWYSESSLTPRHLERFNSGRGNFSAAGSSLVDQSLRYELFKHEDQQIQGLNVYKLGRNIGQGQSEYSFIHDSRWGVWLALNAFAKWLKNPPINIYDASPWPFTYDGKMGCLWIPARMELPYVIERLLALCSGDGPLIVKTQGYLDDDSIVIVNGVRVSPVYSEMKDGRWLCYRYIPKTIASHVASLLGGELKDISG